MGESTPINDALELMKLDARPALESVAECLRQEFMSVGQDPALFRSILEKFESADKEQKGIGLDIEVTDTNEDGFPEILLVTSDKENTASLTLSSSGVETKFDFEDDTLAWITPDGTKRTEHENGTVEIVTPDRTRIILTSEYREEHLPSGVWTRSWPNGTIETHIPNPDDPSLQKVVITAPGSHKVTWENGLGFIEYDDGFILEISKRPKLASMISDMLNGKPKAVQEFFDAAVRVRNSDLPPDYSSGSVNSDRSTTTVAPDNFVVPDDDIEQIGNHR